MAGWVGEWEERLKFGRIGRQVLSTNGTVPGPASLIALLVRICTYIRLRRASDDGFCQSAIMSGARSSCLVSSTSPSYCVRTLCT